APARREAVRPLPAASSPPSGAEYTLLSSSMLPVASVLLSEVQVLAAWCILAGSYIVFALGRFPWMKIDRTGAAIIGAVLMVAAGVVGPDDVLGAIDYATIVLLFAMMVIVANLRIAGFFDRVAEWI